MSDASIPNAIRSGRIGSIDAGAVMSICWPRNRYSPAGCASTAPVLMVTAPTSVVVTDAITGLVGVGAGTSGVAVVIVTSPFARSVLVIVWLTIAL